MSNLTYFRLIPVELVELIVSKLSVEDTESFDGVHSGCHPEDILYYDLLNVFTMKYPYLAKISNLKRNVGYDPSGFGYDANVDTFNDYDILTRDDKLHDYFVTGVIYPDFVKHLRSTLKQFQHDGYDVTDPIIPILVDVYSREYPQIFDELNKVDLGHFAVALYLIDTKTDLLKILTDTQRYHIDFIDEESIDYDIDEIKKKYQNFLTYRDDPREVEGVVGLLLQMISDKYQRENLVISQNMRDWMGTYIDSYKEKLNLPLLAPEWHVGYSLPTIQGNYVL